MNVSIMQENGKTIMEFTKYVQEDGEYDIGIGWGETTTFLYALGSDAMLRKHLRSGSFVVNLDGLETHVTRPPVPAPPSASPSGAMSLTGTMKRSIAGSMVFVFAAWFGL